MPISQSATSTGGTRPEFSLATATPELIGQAIHTCGSALIRAGLARDLIDDVRATVTAGFQLKDRAVQAGQLAGNDRAVLDDRLSVGQYAKLPGGTLQLQRIVRHQLMSLIEGYLGAGMQLLAHRSVIRRQKPAGTTSHTPFHQDGGFLERDRPIIVCWIALDPCGIDAPGLELVTEGMDDLLPITERPGGTAYDSIELAEETIVARFGQEKLWHPAFEPGDVCLMTEHAIHRTYVMPTMTETRHTLLLRFAAAAEQAAVA